MSEGEGSGVAEWYILHAFYGGASSAPPLTVEAAKNCVATHKPAPCTFVPKLPDPEITSPRNQNQCGASRRSAVNSALAFSKSPDVSNSLYYGAVL